MPALMSLEGPRVPTLLGGRLAGTVYPYMPRKVQAAYTNLEGMLTPFNMHRGWAIGMFALGLWLAGTTPGQKLVSKLKGKKR